MAGRQLHVGGKGKTGGNYNYFDVLSTLDSNPYHFTKTCEFDVNLHSNNNLDIIHEPTQYDNHTLTQATDSTLHLAMAAELGGSERNNQTPHGKVNPDLINNTSNAHTSNGQPVAQTPLAQGSKVDDLSSDEIREPEMAWIVPKILKSLRSAHTVEKAQANYHSTLPAFTVFEHATGGCLDSIAAGISGFRSLGGTEDIAKATGRAKARLFNEITNAKCLGDARGWKDYYKSLVGKVDYYKSGMPCTNYASLGDRKGSQGTKGGDLLVDQLQFISHVKPSILRLEITPTALKVNDGAEVAFILSKLESIGYDVYHTVVECWKYGDPSNRSRLMIVGILTELKCKWSWPEHLFHNGRNTYYPTARDISVPDEEVPEEYWRYDRPSTYGIRQSTPKPTRIQQIGSVNPNDSGRAGHSTNPNNIQGWDGVLATQMTTNGGSRRPRLSWRVGESILLR